MTKGYVFLCAALVNTNVWAASGNSMGLVMGTIWLIFAAIVWFAEKEQQ